MLFFSCRESPTWTSAKSWVGVGPLGSCLCCWVLDFCMNDYRGLENTPILTWEIRNRECCQHMGELIGSSTLLKASQPKGLWSVRGRRRLSVVKGLFRSCYTVAISWQLSSSVLQRMQTCPKGGLFALWVSWGPIRAPDWGSLSFLVKFRQKIGSYVSIASFWRWKPTNRFDQSSNSNCWQQKRE